MKKIDYKNIEIQFLWDLFKKVFKSCGVSEKKTKELFEEVVKKYSARGRYYHSVSHIRFMASTWEIFEKKLKSPKGIFMAVIYHDIVYNPKRHDNEEKSLKYFVLNVLPHLKKFSKHDTLTVSAGIMATKHNDEVKSFWTGNKDVQYLLDFDLHILGTPHKSEYDWYREGVRKEYKMYSDEDYKKGRKAVLELFLKRKKIYLTEDFLKTEKIARKNLKNEINSYLC
jgi:predicted metal-dependent HD superfamily phosphohydrolase